MKEPKNYKELTKLLEKQLQDPPKKCGHPFGYKCGCGGEAVDEVFDCVKEMQWRSK